VRIAVTGCEGQVVSSLLERGSLRGDLEVIAVGRPQLDLAQPKTIFPALVSARPDLVVSAAAYTAVDQAEVEPDLAFAVNEIGAGRVAAAAAKLGIPVIHLSTDYVFDGGGERPYVESSNTEPQNVYGASKLAGERAVAIANSQHLILRTAWVYGPFGRNFVKSILRIAADGDEISVVSDQWGNPTSALDLADAILYVAQMLKQRADVPFGIYHLAGTGTTNWSGFAKYILETSSRFGGPSARVREIKTADYPTKAVRPANSRLSTELFANDFGWTAPHWKSSVTETLERLLR
jgi:dTDP-4-dehydrorhamnose reductase